MSPAVFVMSNGVHTDLVLPVESEVIDWRGIFLPVDVPSIQSRIESGELDYIAIGWGDRDFYLNTPSWSDVEAKYVLRAVAGSGATLLHVTWIKPSQFSEDSYRLSLSAGQYETLVVWVLNGLVLQPGSDGVVKPEVLAGSGYGSQDIFYRALGRYHLLRTCNNWTGEALAKAGVTVSRWTPFPATVTWHLQPDL